MIHAFLIIGQSNMAGRGFLADAEPLDTNGGKLKAEAVPLVVGGLGDFLKDREESPSLVNYPYVNAATAIPQPRLRLIVGRWLSPAEPSPWGEGGRGKRGRMRGEVSPHQSPAVTASPSGEAFLRREIASALRIQMYKSLPYRGAFLRTIPVVIARPLSCHCAPVNTPAWQSQRCCWF